MSALERLAERDTRHARLEALMTQLTLLVLAACGGTDAPKTEAPTGENGPIIQELSFFQAVEVPVIADGVNLPAEDRVAPLIVGRQSLVRARLDTSATGLSLVIKIELDGVSQEFVGTTSDEELLVEIPASAMAENSRYTATLWRGSTLLHTVPEGGPAALAPRVTGPTRIRLVPFEVNGWVPDTSSAVVEGYRAALMATFPVTDVELSVGEVQVWEGDLDLGDINVRVGELQEEAMFAGEVPWNMTFYGMVSGVETREELEGITGTSEAGTDDEALVRAYFATGAAFGDQRSEDTFIHEIGHTHRLLHTPCEGEDDPDPNYPHDGGVIGVEGYDFRTGTFVSADTPDLMSYCFPRWVSDYSFAKLADYVANAQSYAGYR